MAMLLSILINSIIWYLWFGWVYEITHLHAHARARKLAYTHKHTHTHAVFEALLIRYVPFKVRLDCLPAVAVHIVSTFQ